MAEKMYLHFLLICGILYEGIIAKLSDEDTTGSLDFLVRKKRVINHLPGGITPSRIEEANYMVNIRENNNAHCTGAIVSHYTVISSASCVNRDVSQYLVLSGAPYENRGTPHNVTSKAVHYGNPPHHLFDGISLITVDPPFVFNRRTGHINLYEGPLLATGTHVTISGWGCSYITQPGPTMRRVIRTITLPIMNHEECKNVYRGRFDITEKHICTYHIQQYCAHSDVGTPLVFNNRMAGIHVWKGERAGLRNPDVFVDLQRDDYSAWIRDNTLLI